MGSSSFFLSRLSPELRNLIYEHAFTSPYAVTLPPASPTRHHQHPLTLTCRAIRHESLPMYYFLTDFNAHLDDGPATPLAKWLKVLGPDLVACIGQINIWDMHMLNGTLHGIDSTARLLSPGIGAASDQKYVLRPLGDWAIQTGWYLEDVILSLRSMGMDLLRFCIVSEPGEDSIPKLTSEFAIVELE
ncbi:Hypothetical predicted protein [Lecanosticta acicola]|uniref:Uncharacterized protein n=1 Tax=Lecanosticta acicola TaxID=111012 RepID=A0AAI9E8K0_9PEZI|nr:Hypothetical predicted protein [Lecanosticta acicola]